jgi:hypothetical protein
MNYFFSSYLPANPDINSKYRELMLKYPDTDKYLYITILQKILFSVSDQEQKELIMALENSEELGQRWLKNNKEISDLITEHLERSILATHSQLL